jgi:hypothetical protein
MMQIVYSGLAVDVQREVIDEGICLFENMSEDEKLQTFQSVLAKIQEAKIKIENGTISPKERQDLCDDVVLACVAEFVYCVNTCLET